MTYYQDSIGKQITVFLLATWISVVTSVSLIFFDVPPILYLNIVGIFIIAVYFKPPFAVGYFLLYQYLFYYFGGKDTFFNYTFILQATNLVIMMTIHEIVKNKLKTGILLSSICMCVFSKPIAMLVSGVLFQRPMYFSSLWEISSIVRQIQTYLFSGAVTYVLCNIAKRCGFFKGVKNES